MSDEIQTLKKANFIMSKKYEFAKFDYTRLNEELHIARAQIGLLENDVEVYKAELAKLRNQAEEELKKAAEEAYEAKVGEKHAKRELKLLKKKHNITE